MSVQQELLDLAEALRDSNHDLTPASLNIQYAVRCMDTLARVNSDRWINHFNAALTGLCAGNTKYSAENVVKIVDAAMNIADLAVTRKSLLPLP